MALVEVKSEVPVEEPSSLAQASPKKRNAKPKKQGCKRPPAVRSSFADARTPLDGVERRSALNRIYEERRQKKRKMSQDIESSAAASAPDFRPLKDKLNDKFRDAAHLLFDTQTVVKQEMTRLEQQGRALCVDYEERRDFLILLRARLLGLRLEASDDEETNDQALAA
ncbi:unnamed protein product [Symbiodinium pilosum]|uniref:Uncharacterized protein n=1 Tax=Symbiodinium pilosum TaxID=2952 RepID=A0A812PTF0_SYMPI|nr:unnamed protein product [Symbiodinium pilosum]